MQGHLMQRCHQFNLTPMGDNWETTAVDDGAPAVRSRLAKIEPGKRKSI